MEQLIPLNQLKAGFYLITRDDCKQDMFQTTAVQPQEVGNITHDLQVLPFLSLKDNLLLGVKRRMKLKLRFYLLYMELSPNIFTQSIDELSSLDKLKLQLIRQLLQQKKVLFLTHCCESLSIQEIQWFLPFCQELAHSQQLKILLFSSDKQLTATPYIDKIL